MGFGSVLAQHVPGGTPGGGGSSATWASNGYIWRSPIVISGERTPGITPLTGFLFRYQTTLVTLRSEANGGNVKSASGWDIRFEDLDGNKLPHRFLAAYAPTTGAVDILVRIPTLNAVGETVIYKFTGKTLTATEEDIPGVYADYLDCWDCRTGTSLKGVTARDMTAKDTLSAQTIVGDGANHSLGYLQSATTAWFTGHSALTMQAVVNVASGAVGTDKGVLAQGALDGVTGNHGFALQLQAKGKRGGKTNVVSGIVTTSAGSVVVESAASSHQTGTRYWAMVYESGRLGRLNINGVDTVPSWAGTVVGATVTPGGTLTGTTSAKTGNWYIGYGADGTASDAAVTSAQIRASWRMNVPWLPVSDNDIVVVDVPIGGVAANSTNSIGTAGKVALLVPPSDGIITGPLNFRNTKWAGIIACGVLFRPASNTTATTPAGKTAGGATCILWNTTADSATGEGRPYFFLANSEMNAVNTKWGDFIKFGGSGANRANYPDLIIQRMKVTNGHYGFTDNTLTDGNAPHSDFTQTSLGNGTFNRYICYDSDLRWQYQVYFHRPEVGRDMIGTTSDIRGVTVRYMPHDTNVYSHATRHTPGKICDMVDGNNGAGQSPTSAQQYSNGLYMGYTFEDCVFVDDPAAYTSNLTVKATITSYFDSAGLTVSTNATDGTIEWTSPAQAPNTLTPVTGFWTMVSTEPADDATGGKFGKDYRITTVAKLREVTGT